MIASYQDLLVQKSAKPKMLGFENIDPHKLSKPHQRDCLRMLLNVRRGAAFLDTGLGKTFLQLDWARHIPGKVLIVTPLAVAQQTIREANNLMGIKDIGFSSDGSVNHQITVTNYERLDNFDGSQFEGVVLDESSILKGKNSKTKAQICSMFGDTEYRLACTATPAPNDYTELGNHAEFLGLMTTQEMLMRWFIHDSANTADWRLKGHAVRDFWDWVSSWAACVTMPSDLGYDDEGYDLPPFKTVTHVIKTELKQAEGMLFDIGGISSTELHSDKRETINGRCEHVADLVNNSNEPWIVWCESNDESDLLARLIPDAVDVKGADSPESKERKALAFSDGEARVIISKSSIFGYGLNWQHCRKMAFASISYSFEKYYQAVRRIWRFGQTGNVEIHVTIADREIDVWRAIERKAENHQLMKSYMKYTKLATDDSGSQTVQDYEPCMDGALPDFL